MKQAGHSGAAQSSACAGPGRAAVLRGGAAQSSAGAGPERAAILRGGAAQDGAAPGAAPDGTAAAEAGVQLPCADRTEIVLGGGITCVFGGTKSGPARAEAGLEEYRRAQCAAAASEARLEEYCTAIEEFDLRGAPPQGAPVRCRDGLFTPGEVLARADTEARRLEQLTAAASAARGRVLTRILRGSRDLAEYRALRRRYVDAADLLAPGDADALYGDFFSGGPGL